MSYFAGIVDENDAVHEGGFGAALRAVLGMSVEESLPLRDGEHADYVVAVNHGDDPAVLAVAGIDVRTGRQAEHEVPPGNAVVLRTPAAAPSLAQVTGRRSPARAGS